jgi:protein involved in polysaccharide export with SLBB domain
MHVALIFMVLMLGAAVAPGAAPAQQPATHIQQNHLEPGDLIRLRVWREETISGDYRVAADGTVVLPRLGPWQVTGKDPVRLKDELISEYSRYLRTPAIEVVYLRRIVVGGAVMRPAVYHIDPTMTVRDVLLEAGGPTPVGRMDRIELIRDGAVTQARLRQDLPIVESPVRSGDQLYVPERSWLARNTNAAVGIGGALLSFAATMIILAASR